MGLPAVDNEAVGSVLTDDGHNTADGGAGIHCEGVVFVAAVEVGRDRCRCRIDGHGVGMVAEFDFECCALVCLVLQRRDEAETANGVKTGCIVMAEAACEAILAVAHAQINAVRCAAATPRPRINPQATQGCQRLACQAVERVFSLGVVDEVPRLAEQAFAGVCSQMEAIGTILAKGRRLTTGCLGDSPNKEAVTASAATKFGRTAGVDARRSEQFDEVDVVATGERDRWRENLTQHCHRHPGIRVGIVALGITLDGNRRGTTDQRARRQADVVARRYSHLGTGDQTTGNRRAKERRSRGFTAWSCRHEFKVFTCPSGIVDGERDASGGRDGEWPQQGVGQIAFVEYRTDRSQIDVALRIDHEPTDTGYGIVDRNARVLPVPATGTVDLDGVGCCANPTPDGDQVDVAGLDVGMHVGCSRFHDATGERRQQDVGVL